MTFEEYWVLFVKDHTRFGTQLAHVVGNLLMLGLIFAALVFGPWWLLLVSPAPALILARLSHLLIERNVPLKAVENPKYFLRCEFRMMARFFSGKMTGEVKKIVSDIIA